MIDRILKRILILIFRSAVQGSLFGESSQAAGEKVIRFYPKTLLIILYVTNFNPHVDWG